MISWFTDHCLSCGQSCRSAVQLEEIQLNQKFKLNLWQVVVYPIFPEGPLSRHNSQFVVTMTMSASPLITRYPFWVNYRRIPLTAP